ncbi:hypothetical protein [Lacimicrobium sp. SS2-24]|uniref:hypothetical protein n=1 Tax=Lacimicrobium sp. SS2-24 TaxID=2005569 RepID=UPI000B4B1B9E|nr:hypothetical protein [Lacimicrobium sp. SS2-24]
MNNERLYQLHVSGNVLCVKLRHIWSKQVVKKVFGEVQQAVADITDEPWAAYVDMREWIMPTIEALQDFQLIYDWCAQNNQTHEATVCKFAMQERIVRESSGYDPEFHFYTQSPAEAQSWLLAQGFTFSLPPF